MSNKKYAVGYEGWVIVEAPNEDAAMTEVCNLLEEWNVLNDGELGEWLIADIETVEDEEE